MLDGALNDLLQHPDWEAWRSDVARASFRPGELDAFMDSHRRYKQRPDSPESGAATAANQRAVEEPAVSKQMQG